MDATFWHERWTTNQIGFHQLEINPSLQSTWSKLTPNSSETVLVPLCGKSKDLLWLRNQGHTVIGVELSPLAIRDFFQEAQLGPPVVRTQGAFEVSSVGNIHLYCGDFLKLRPQDLPSIPTLVYDRAALIALPPSMRCAYLQIMQEVTANTAKILLISLSYPPDEMSGPPFSIPTDSVEKLYHDGWILNEQSKADILATNGKFKDRGVSSLFEHVHILEKR